MQQEFFGEVLGGREWHERKCAEVEEGCADAMLQTVVAEVAGRVAGYATYIFDEDRGVAVIGNNAVLPDFQGRGIGKRLQAEVDRRMRAEGYTRFEVDTLSIDLAAQHVYERQGYQRYAESVRYLRKG